MKGRIPNSFVRELIESTDIVEIISRFVKLKKTGKNFMTCCPFHNEKTPSFSVSADKQLYHCFGCHASGDVINFLSEHERLSFVEAVEELASLKGVSVPYENDRDALAKDSSSYESDIVQLHQALNDANRYFRWNLSHHANAPKVIEYLKSRGLSKETVKRFEIGYAPDLWQGLYQVLGSKYTPNILEKAGLVIQGTQHKFYDRFRHRVTFPIYNRRGQVIAFGGRVLSNDGKQPKYLNSPETSVFHKGSELYGLYQLKQRHKPEHIMVVEGYMDVIALAEGGYPYAVATLGTALSEEHTKRLFRESNQLIFCFDGDNAGQTAAIRAFQIVFPMLNAHREALFLSLPEDEDPDSYIKRVGKEVFMSEIQNALSAPDFFLQFIKKDWNLSSTSDVAKLLEQAKSILNALPENSYYTSILRTLAKMLEIPLTQLRKIFQNPLRSDSEKKIVKPRHLLNINKLTLLERATAYALSMPEALSGFLIQNPLPEFDQCSEQHFILLDALKIIRQNDGLNSAMLVQILSEKHGAFREYFYQLLSIPVELDAKLRVKEFSAMLDKLSVEASHNELALLIDRSKEAILTKAEKDRLQKLLHKKAKI